MFEVGLGLIVFSALALFVLFRGESAEATSIGEDVRTDAFQEDADLGVSGGFSPAYEQSGAGMLFSNFNNEEEVTVTGLSYELDLRLTKP